MSDDVPGEANTALFTAGIVMAVVGAVLATFPKGLVLGIGIGVAGVVLFAVFSVRAWRDRRRRPTASTSTRFGRLWNLQNRITGVWGVALGSTIGTIGVSLLDQNDIRWPMLWLFGPLLVLSTIALVILRVRVRRENRTRRADANQVAVGGRDDR